MQPPQVAERIEESQEMAVIIFVLFSPRGDKM
jgi:hypothetical protein